MEDDAKKRVDRYQRAGAAGLGALLGATMGGPAGAIVGASMGVLLEPLAERVGEELVGDVRRRRGEMLAAVQETLGVEPSELEDLVLSSDASRLQTAIALSAATRTTWSAKVRALGRALASGLLATDDTLIDTQPLIMASLADIEFPHASLLELLVCHWPRVGTPLVIAVPFTLEGGVWVVGQRVWSEDDIVQVRPQLKSVLPSLIGTLQRHGLALQGNEPIDPMGRTVRTMNERFISDRASHGGGDANLRMLPRRADTSDWMPTELGQEVIDLLREAGEEFKF